MVFLKKSFKVLIASLEANRGSIKKQLKENEIINKNIKTVRYIKSTVVHVKLASILPCENIRQIRVIFIDFFKKGTKISVCKRKHCLQN